MVPCYYLVKLWIFCMTFIYFFGTNLLIQCQVPVPVFSMFLTPLRGDFETEVKWKKIPENIFSGTEEDRRAWGPSQKSPTGPTCPHLAARGRAIQACGLPGAHLAWPKIPLDFFRLGKNHFGVFLPFGLHSKIRSEKSQKHGKNRNWHLSQIGRAHV